MSSACEVVNVSGGFKSEVNKCRIELDVKQVTMDGDDVPEKDKIYYRIDDKVKAVMKTKGKTEGVIQRFSRANGMYFADVQFKLDKYSPLIMINILYLERIQEKRPHQRGH